MSLSILDIIIKVKLKLDLVNNLVSTYGTSWMNTLNSGGSGGSGAWYLCTLWSPTEDHWTRNIKICAQIITTAKFQMTVATLFLLLKLIAMKRLL